MVLAAETGPLHGGARVRPRTGHGGRRGLGGDPVKCVDQITVRLRLAGRAPRPAPQHLRGAVAARFPEDPLFHQHAGDGLLYRLPRIQYRWDEEGPALVGLEEGARRLLAVDWPG